jgi:hypothetical protein
MAPIHAMRRPIEKCSDQERTFSPCFRTTASSPRAMPPGRLAPVSYFCTVDSLGLLDVKR